MKILIKIFLVVQLTLAIGVKQVWGAAEPFVVSFEDLSRRFWEIDKEVKLALMAKPKTLEPQNFKQRYDGAFKRFRGLVAEYHSQNKNSELLPEIQQALTEIETIKNELVSLAPAPATAPTFTESYATSAPTKRMPSQILRECPICLTEFDTSQGTFFPCGHWVCNTCNKELKEKQCPECRIPLDQSQDQLAQMLYTESLKTLLVQIAGDLKARKIPAPTYDAPQPPKADTKEVIVTRWGTYWETTIEIDFDNDLGRDVKRKIAEKIQRPPEQIDLILNGGYIGDSESMAKYKNERGVLHFRD